MTKFRPIPQDARWRPDRLGVVVAALVLFGLYAQPFALVRANRIVAPQSRAIWESLPAWEATLSICGLTAAALFLLLPARAIWRLGAVVPAVILLAVTIGNAASHLSPVGNTYARISPGGGFWILLGAWLVGLADGMVRLRLSPSSRLIALAAAVLLVGVIILTGTWGDLSILREYDNNQDVFWRETRAHLFLACGSLAVATCAGIPLGILCYRCTAVRGPILGALNLIQTIPSIALFGLLMAPLAWIATVLPGARAIGIAGIGPTPAFIALFGYALLPIVANTDAGLAGISPQARDAARGVGMTAAQRLLQVELPLALPVILTGIRVVLVQNIGLAVIAALIGGGGLGVFIFQGINQTATDLVLMGTIPVVAMAFAAAIILDALVDLNRTHFRKGDEA